MTTNSNEPSPDAIVAGIHQIREDLLKAHSGDLRAYFEAARKRQYESKLPLKPKPETMRK
jgi:hypothetical protein